MANLTNAKIAYNPQLSVDSHHILKDNRFDLLQNAGSLNIDIVKQSVRERVLKFLVDNFKTYALNGQSSVKFIQWVANRSAFTETMQNLYQVLLSTSPISSDNQDILDAIQLSLSEQLFNEPSETEIPLGVSLVEVETQPEDDL